MDRGGDNGNGVPLPSMDSGGDEGRAYLQRAILLRTHAIPAIPLRERRVVLGSGLLVAQEEELARLLD